MSMVSNALLSKLSDNFLWEVFEQPRVLFGVVYLPVQFPALIVDGVLGESVHIAIIDQVVQ